jgi:hypothetical protein
MLKRNSIAEINATHLTNKREQMANNIALCEASPSISKKVFPLTLERRVLVNMSKRRVVFYDELLRQVCFQTPSPFSKRAWIVRRDEWDEASCEHKKD